MNCYDKLSSVNKALGGKKEEQGFTVMVRLLLPLARFYLKRGFKIQEMSEALKRALVQAASEEISARAEKPNVSRLAVMTGLHRRDVMRLTASESPAGGKENLLTKIIGQWRSDKRYSTKRGPKALSLTDESPSFSSLVFSTSQDLNPGTVLFELERLGAVEKKEGSVLLRVEAFEPVAGDTSGGLALLAEDVASFVDGVDKNLYARQDVPNLHIRTSYDNIVREAVPEIRRWFLAKGAEFHELARRFLSQYDKDLNPALYDKEGGGKVSLGTFSNTAEPPATQNEDSKNVA